MTIVPSTITTKPGEIDLFFTTEGNATDNTLTIRDGRPERSLRVYQTEADLAAAQQEIWTSSAHRRNRVPLSAVAVERIFGDQLVYPDGSTEDISFYLDRVHGYTGERPDADDPQPAFVLRFLNGQYFTEPFSVMTLAETEIWYGNQ